MKTFTAKTLEEVLELAATELGVDSNDLSFEIVEEVKGLLRKKCVINTYDIEDAANYGVQYLLNVFEAMEIKAEVTQTLNGEIIRINIDSEQNPLIIGKNGKTLQAFNDITRLAINTKFKKRFHVLLDVGDYKDRKYSKIMRIARSVAKEVQKTHTSAKLDPMTSDERRIVHNVLTNFSNIKTESAGEGTNRAIIIKYIGK